MAQGCSFIYYLPFFWLHVTFGSECPCIFKISHKNIFIMQCTFSVGDTNRTMEVSWAQTAVLTVLTVKKLLMLKNAQQNGHFGVDWVFLSIFGSTETSLKMIPYITFCMGSFFVIKNVTGTVLLLFINLPCCHEVCLQTWEKNHSALFYLKVAISWAHLSGTLFYCHIKCSLLCFILAGVKCHVIQNRSLRRNQRKPSSNPWRKNP